MVKHILASTKSISMGFIGINHKKRVNIDEVFGNRSNTKLFTRGSLEGLGDGFHNLVNKVLTIGFVVIVVSRKN